MKCTVRPKCSRAVKLAALVTVFALPLILQSYYLVEYTLSVFTVVFLCLISSRITLIDSGQFIEITSRIFCFRLVSRVEKFDAIKLNHQVWGGAANGENYDVTVIEQVLGEDDRLIFSFLERTVFGSNHLAQGIKSLINFNWSPRSD